MNGQKANGQERTFKASKKFSKVVLGFYSCKVVLGFYSSLDLPDLLAPGMNTTLVEKEQFNTVVPELIKLGCKICLESLHLLHTVGVRDMIRRCHVTAAFFPLPALK